MESVGLNLRDFDLFQRPPRLHDIHDGKKKKKKRSAKTSFTEETKKEKVKDNYSEKKKTTEKGKQLRKARKEM